MTKIRSISITDEQNTWLEEHDYISPSLLFQTALEQQKNFENQSASHAENKALRERIEKVVERSQQKTDWIQKKGLIDEYLKEVEGL